MLASLRHATSRQMGRSYVKSRQSFAWPISKWTHTKGLLRTTRRGCRVVTRRRASTLFTRKRRLNRRNKGSTIVKLRSLCWRASKLLWLIRHSATNHRRALTLPKMTTLWSTNHLPHTTSNSTLRWFLSAAISPLKAFAAKKMLARAAINSCLCWFPRLKAHATWKALVTRQPLASCHRMPRRKICAIRGIIAHSLRLSIQRRASGMIRVRKIASKSSATSTRPRQAAWTNKSSRHHRSQLGRRRKIQLWTIQLRSCERFCSRKHLKMRTKSLMRKAILRLRCKLLTSHSPRLKR